MNGDLVIFNHDTYCMEESSEYGMINLCIASGNVGIIVSKYCKDPTIELDAYEILVGDRVVIDVDENSFTNVGDNKC